MLIAYYPLLNKHKKIFFNRSKKELQFSEDAPESYFPKSNLFEEFNEIEIARQICLYEQELYQQIEPKELLNQSWNKKKENSPHVLLMIEFFNVFSNFIVTKILSYDTVKERGNSIIKFLRILENLRLYNNFDSCQAICSALSSGPIYRLELSWKKAKKDKKLYSVYEEIHNMLGDGSFTQLRNTLKNLTPPCIPYLGMYLKDLTFLEDGNLNYLEVEGGAQDIINFEKMRRVANVIHEIILYQPLPYNFNRNELILDLLKNKLISNTEMENFQRSRDLETKGMVEEFRKTRSRKESIKVQKNSS